MAEHADGSIIVDTEIDAQGFKAGSSELKGAIKSLNTKIQSLGPTFQKALSGNSSAIATFEAKASALESTISEIEAKMESLSSKRVPTEDYQWLSTEIQKAQQELSKLYDKQSKMEATGVKQSSRSWQSLQYDIDLAKRKIAEYEAEQASMRTNGTAFQMGSSTAEYAQLESSLASARNRLAEIQAQAEAARGSTSRLAQIGNTLKSVFGRIGTFGKKVFTGFINGAKAGISKLKQFSKSSSGCMGAISKLGKKLTGLGSMLKRMALRKIMMGILTAVKDGFNNLAQYSSQTNADLSTLKSALTQLKNSFATAFAPILSVVTPILAKLIGYLSTALTFIGKLFAALSGAKTFTKATAVQEDYAASLGATGSAAEKAKKQLAGFDELNVLSDNSPDGGGGGGGGASPSEMFEEVPIDSSITDFVEKLKEAFKNGDYDGIGEIIGNGINTAVQKVNDFISWNKVEKKITKGVKAVAQCFNSIVDTVDWENIGDTFAQGFNTAINTLFLVITEFDWPGLAAGLARSLNGLVSGIDWGKFGKTLSTGMKTAIATLRSAITTFNWSSLGKGIADAINNIDWPGLLSSIAGSISDVLKGALDLVIGFAENLDWGKLGRDLWNSLIGIVTNIDWGGLISKAFRLLGAALGGCTSLIVEFCKSLWDSLKSGVESTKAYFNKYIEEAGGNVILGLLNGIWNGIKNIGNWIVENIWNPFIEGFKKAFGIHSPSTKMAEMGGYIIEGLWNGIKAAWGSIVEFFTNALAGIKKIIKSAWEGIKSFTSTVWGGIKSFLSSTWNGIKSLASTVWNGLKSTISSGWNSIKSFTSSAWSGIKSSLSSTWNSVKSTASSTWNSLKSTISTGWENIKTKTSTTWTNIKTSLSTTWSNIKTSASTTWGNLKSTISTGWENIKTATSTKWTNIKTSLSTAWDSIKTTATTKWNNLKSTISTAWENIKTGASTAWTNITTSLSNAWTNIKTNASTTWTNLKSTISTGWENIKTSTSTKWNAIKSSLSTTWDGIKTTASTKWNNLKSTISTAWDSVKTTASSKWESIKTTLSGKWDSIKSTATTKWNNLKSTISTGWNNIKSNASSTWDTIKSNLSSKWDSIKSTASTKWDSIKNTIKNKGWSGVGSDICNGISSGINSGWTWLKTKVGEVANSLLAKAKSTLGIHSPSRLFRDIVGLNIGYGIGEGIEASEGSVVKTVTGLADAIAAEANSGEYNIGGVVSTAEVNGALTGFSDKVANSFSTLLERLQAIADGVTFTMPAMATGTIVPYSVSASSADGNNVTGAIEASNDELGSVIIQAVTNATTAIVAAIEANSGTVVNFDANSIATSTIKEINRRTRAMGKSPLVTT